MTSQTRKRKATKRNKIVEGLEQATKHAKLQAATEGVREWISEFAPQIKMHWRLVEKTDEHSRKAAREALGEAADAALLEKAAEAIFAARLAAEEKADSERLADFLAIHEVGVNGAVSIVGRGVISAIVRALKKHGYADPVRQAA
jgi:lysyl-tRNA synthetase class I